MVVLALCAGVWTAAASGHQGIAVSLLAVLLGAVLLGVLHLSRWMGGIYRANQTAQPRHPDRRGADAAPGRRDGREGTAHRG